MLVRRARVLTGSGLALGFSLLVALSSASPASAAATGVPTFRPGHALYDVGVSSGASQAEAARAAAASPTFTQFKSTVKVGTKTYTYVLAGRNPAVRVAHAAATVTTELVPLIIKFPNGDSWNPTVADSCDAGASPLARVQKSPIFVSQAWNWGGTPIGTGQVTDAFQRAEFWRYARPGGTNPSYAVSLAVTTLRPVTINVPAADAAIASISCGNHLAGAINVNWLDPFVRRTVIPSLKGVGPSTLPVFILHNVVEYVGTTSKCCVLGYHNAYKRGSGLQTYSLATYDNSRVFRGSSDISALSHEVGEWVNDPYGTNATPSWGHTGQVSACQANLEVGDPLSGTTFADKRGTFTYHPQELAFFSWFYHQRPSLGVHGWYSDQGKFRTFAAPC
jgi:hypothetical protein